MIHITGRSGGIKGLQDSDAPDFSWENDNYFSRCWWWWRVDEVDEIERGGQYRYREYKQSICMHVQRTVPDVRDKTVGSFTVLLTTQT